MPEIATWDRLAEYDVGAMCLHAGRVWRAVAPNAGTVPAMSTGGPWELFGVPAEQAIGNTRGNPHVTEVGP